MGKILLPTDFSDTAKNALLYALNLADVLNFEVKIVSIYPNLAKEDNEDDFNIQANKLIDFAKNNELGHIKIETEKKDGDLLINILDIIRIDKIDFVVMGTNGQNNLEKKIFGSNTINVIQNSTVPVLAIPKNIRFIDDRNFAYATLFRQKENDAIDKMLNIAKKNNTTFKIVHIENKLLTQEMLKTKAEWEEKHPQIPIVLQSNEDVETGLMTFCKKNNINVLGVTHRELPFLKRLFSVNHSSQLLEIEGIALIVFRES